jgi:hypothetical protein
MFAILVLFPHLTKPGKMHACRLHVLYGMFSFFGQEIQAQLETGSTTISAMTKS